MPELVPRLLAACRRTDSGVQPGRPPADTRLYRSVGAVYAACYLAFPLAFGGAARLVWAAITVPVSLAGVACLALRG